MRYDDDVINNYIIYCKDYWKWDGIICLRGNTSWWKKWISNKILWYRGKRDILLIGLYNK